MLIIIDKILLFTRLGYIVSTQLLCELPEKVDFITVGE